MNSRFADELFSLLVDDAAVVADERWVPHAARVLAKSVELAGAHARTVFVRCWINSLPLETGKAAFPIKPACTRRYICDVIGLVQVGRQAHGSRRPIGRIRLKVGRLCFA